MSGEGYWCGNCGRAIGALEQPYQWGDYIVCHECAARLQQQSTPEYQPPADALLFRHKQIAVKQSGIYDQGGYFPMDEVLSVRTIRGFWWGFRVIVYDAAGGKASYHFPNRGLVSRFVAAVASARGHLNVDEDTSWFGIRW